MQNLTIRKLLDIFSLILKKHPVFFRGLLANRHPWRFYARRIPFENTPKPFFLKFWGDYRT
jgi:hypothetical protein